MPLFANTLMVTDLDATFFSDPSRLAKRNLEAVEFFKSEGGYFTAATGRIARNGAHRPQYSPCHPHGEYPV